jgi:hypothetical protein
VTKTERKLLPFVRAKVPAAVSVFLPMGNGFDSWCRAYTDKAKRGFQIVYLHEILPQTRWPEFGLVGHPVSSPALPYTV